MLTIIRAGPRRISKLHRKKFRAVVSVIPYTDEGDAARSGVGCKGRVDGLDNYIETETIHFT